MWWSGFYFDFIKIIVEGKIEVELCLFVVGDIVEVCVDLVVECGDYCVILNFMNVGFFKYVEILICMF